MAYQTYITEALVCGVFDNNTSDRTFLLFTKEAGMLYAHAKSVREEKSKQRDALQVASHIRVTLVRGKSGWKIAGTEPLQKFYARTKTREERALVRNVILLLRRVIQGEIAQSTIFNDIVSVFGHDISIPPDMCERIVTLRTLYTLGYIAPAPIYDALVQGEMSPETLALCTEDMCAACDQAIYNAFMQSQL